MASIISAGTSSNTALNVTADTSGSLVLATNSGTTALTLNTSQNATFAGSVNAPNTFGFKNRIINGAMMISQYYGTSASANSINGYFIDRFAVYQSTSGKLIAQQNAGSVTPPVGFSNYLGITSQSAYSVGSGDYYFIEQCIEGFNTADLAWGTINAKTVTLSFQVYSSLTGTFGGAFRNSAANRAYPFTYTISSANTWTTVSVTLTGDTTGTWLGATNGIGIAVRFGLGAGSTYSASAGSWSNGNIVSATGATSVVGTNGATFYITGVQLEVGSQATSFDYRDYGRELIMCQRYYQIPVSGSQQLVSLMVRPDGYRQIFYPFKTTMRTTPTSSFTWNNDTSGVNAGTPTITPDYWYVWSASQIATSNLNPYITALSLSAEL